MPRPVPSLPSQPLLTVPDVAHLLAVQPRRVYEMVATRTIPHLHIGRQVRFEREALARWLDGQRQQVAS